MNPKLAIPAILLWFGPLPGQAAAPAENPAQQTNREIEAAKHRWAESPHGAMLARILPPAVEPRQVPEPDSKGAELLGKYCVQCHYLPSAHMHSPQSWPAIVERMNWRMQGKGNMGTLMKDMMEDVKAPTEDELRVLIAYLKKHGQKPINPKEYPDLKTPEGTAFDGACSQCHELPDPKRHTATEWTRVVERMKRNLEWVGTIQGKTRNPKGELKVEQILQFLHRHSRPR